MLGGKLGHNQINHVARFILSPKYVKVLKIDYIRNNELYSGFANGNDSVIYFGTGALIYLLPKYLLSFPKSQAV